MMEISTPVPPTREGTLLLEGSRGMGGWKPFRSWKTENKVGFSVWQPLDCRVP